MQHDKLMSTQVGRRLLWKRSLVAILILVAYVLISETPLPLVRPDILRHITDVNQSKTLTLLMMLAGGNLETGSIALVGLMPYMLVQMLVQLLQTGLVPAIKHMAELPDGNQRVGKLVEVLSMICDFVTAWLILTVINRMSYGLLIQDTRMMVLISLFVTVGSMMLLYLAQLDTLYGLGNGVTYVIAISILVQLFEQNQHWHTFLHSLTHGLHLSATSVIVGGIVVIVVLNLLCYWFQTSSYIIPLQFAKLDSSLTRNGELPFSLNVANVMPVILTSMTMNFCLIIGQLNHWHYWTTYFDFKHMNSVWVFIAMIIFMCFFTTLVQYYPPTMSKRLAESGVYVAGQVPGKNTTWYLLRKLVLLATLSAIFYLAVIGILMWICYAHHINANMVFGISSILIVLSAFVDISNQIKGLYHKSLKLNLIN